MLTCFLTDCSGTQYTTRSITLQEQQYGKVIGALALLSSYRFRIPQYQDVCTSVTFQRLYSRGKTFMQLAIEFTKRHI